MPPLCGFTASGKYMAKRGRNKYQDGWLKRYGFALAAALLLLGVGATLALAPNGAQQTEAEVSE